MRIPVEDLIVYFPYDYVYPEQYDYMLALKQTLDSGNGHCLLEMPTGTGKTVSLLSLIVSYQLSKPDVGKLVYCTRTVQEMDKVMQEIKRVFEYVNNEFPKDMISQNQNQNQNQNQSDNQHSTIDMEDIQRDLGIDLDVDMEDMMNSGLISNKPTNNKSILRKNLCVCLSARRNLCIHPEVSQFDDRDKIDALCRNKTASWVRSNSKTSPTHLCEFFEGYQKFGTDAGLEGIYSLEDLKILGRSKKWCPYFVARHLITIANIVVYNYQYMLDPKISNLVSRDLAKDCIVVFDEAHNIDNICIEALSVRLDRRRLHGAVQNLNTLNRMVVNMEQSDVDRLNNEYRTLVQGLIESNNNANNNDSSTSTGIDMSAFTDTLLANPVLSDDILQQAIPGNIRKSKHFLNFLKTFIEYLKQRMNAERVIQEESLTFVSDFQKMTGMHENQLLALRFCHDRLHSLFRTLEVSDLDTYTPLVKVSTLACLVGTYSQGFKILIEPYDTRTPTIKDPILQLCCLDASIAMQPVLKKFRNVIITSGTLSPMDFYPKILRFDPKIVRSFDMTLSRPCICPLIITKGNDQIPLTSKYESRRDLSVVKNYGELLLQMAHVIPDGIVCFFTSYAYMEEIVSEWSKIGMLQEIMQSKLIFIETKDIVETSLALNSYKKACDCGRGAIFLSVARGKVAEGVDFDRHYGRCVILFGIPFQYSLSRVLRARLDYLKEQFDIGENNFLAFDALRQAAQCVGRVIRSKLDYGLMIFADYRYTRADKRTKLPQWISNHLRSEYASVSTDVAVEIAAQFIKKMGQPHSKKDEIGKSLLSEKDLHQKLKILYSEKQNLNNNSNNNTNNNDHKTDVIMQEKEDKN